MRIISTDETITVSEFESDQLRLAILDAVMNMYDNWKGEK